MSTSGEATMATHKVKELELESLNHFRARSAVPIPGSELAGLPYYRPAPDSPEMKYMHAQRKRLGGYLPSRKDDFEALETPTLEALKGQLKGTGERRISTTMSFMSTLSALLKDKKIGSRNMPIVPDEARHIGMEGMRRITG